MGNSALSAVYFYGKVSIISSVFCGNSSLKDIYFYSDDVTEDESNTSSILQSNDSELVLHGISGGNVEALAEKHGLKFEEITAEEVGEQ